MTLSGVDFAIYGDPISVQFVGRVSSRVVVVPGTFEVAGAMITCVSPVFVAEEEAVVEVALNSQVFLVCVCVCV